MAGHGAEDPAIERFNRMREEAYKNFRWTRQTTRTALLGFIIVPGVIYYFSNQYHMKWDWVAKRKGESLDTVSKSQTD
ncbi:hypothetical protein BD779DRAFT_1205329 [Infundibulicybe gibba]|nr:hypothetical protein BD779DRAFT_1205329 [Infundibulicybe gibba]